MPRDAADLPRFLVNLPSSMSASAETSLDVEVRREFSAPPERVFDAFIDARVASKFLFATPSGTMIEARTDPRPGGSFLFTERREGEDVEHQGAYVEVTRPSRLVFDFCVTKYSKDRARVTIAIAPKGVGSEVTLTHRLHPDWVSFIERAAEGWRKMLEGLARALGEG
jgi:uncharacterized protein YndB with AHSA1/START domain